MEITTFGARYEKGVFQPLEEIDLEEGAEVLLTIEAEYLLTEEEEDAALARAMAEGMKTPFMDPQEVFRPPDERLPVSDDAEDIALGKLIAEGLTEERVDPQVIKDILRGRAGR